MGLGNLAAGLTDGIMMIKARYGDIPIYITENGLGRKTRLLMAKSSTIRGSTISAAILMRWKKRWRWGRCARLLPWSFIDLLSWLNGYQKQYGFVYVDHQQNLARKRKRVFLVQNVIASQANSVNLLPRRLRRLISFRIFLNFF
jgi:6-phospho-beta-glucosidase